MAVILILKLLKEMKRLPIYIYNLLILPLSLIWIRYYS